MYLDLNTPRNIIFRNKTWIIFVESHLIQSLDRLNIFRHNIDHIILIVRKTGHYLERKVVGLEFVDTLTEGGKLYLTRTDIDIITCSIVTCHETDPFAYDYIIVDTALHDLIF